MRVWALNVGGYSKFLPQKYLYGIECFKYRYEYCIGLTWMHVLSVSGNTKSTVLV